MPSKHSGRRAGYVNVGPCRQCDRPADVAGHISQRGLCADCAAENMAAAGRELQAREGPHFEEWRKRNLEAAQRFADAG